MTSKCHVQGRQKDWYAEVPVWSKPGVIGIPQRSCLLLSIQLAYIHGFISY